MNEHSGPPGDVASKTTYGFKKNLWLQKKRKKNKTGKAYKKTYGFTKNANAKLQTKPKASKKTN